MKVHSNHLSHPPPSMEKFKTLASMKKMSTTVIIKSSELFQKCIRYVWRNKSKPNTTKKCNPKDNETMNAAVGGSHWVGLKPRKTLSLPDALIFRGARKPIWDDGLESRCRRIGTRPC